MVQQHARHHRSNRGHLLVRHKSFDYYLHPTTRNTLVQLNGQSYQEKEEGQDDNANCCSEGEHHQDIAADAGLQNPLQQGDIKVHIANEL